MRRSGIGPDRRIHFLENLMTSDHTDLRLLRYKNPVFPHSFPDPFVLKHNGEYFAYCTGHWHDGRVFGVLRSTDLVNWKAAGGAMEPLDDPAPYYWAPELIYSDGTFFLYYSVGNETLMHLRVAVSDRPDGGFRDAGHRLTSDDFAIDAHVFRDEDGSEYLFYATDFLEHTHIGTGIVMDRMLDRFTLAGEARPVVRAKYDWQVYDPARKEKGGVRWHTVEGPFVFKRKGTYFVMFSGGNWQNPTYGVSFATSSTLNRDGEWDQFCDGEKLLPILSTYPEKLVGPGHNSVVRGPNNRELYCVYHCWEGGERVVAVNRMDFVDDRLIIEDEPFQEKLFPFLPDPRYAFEGGGWIPKAQGPGPDSVQRRTLDGLPSSFLCEFGFVARTAGEGGTFGFQLEDDDGILNSLVFSVSGDGLICRWEDGPGVNISELDVLPVLSPAAVHLVRLEIDHALVRVWIDGHSVPIDQLLPGPASGLTLFTEASEVEWSAFQLTEGFENGFERADGASLQMLGWAVDGTQESVVFGEGELILLACDERELLLSKGPAAGEFEFSAVLRLINALGPESRFGFVLTGVDERILYEFGVIGANGTFRLVDDSQSISFDLPLWYQSGRLHRFGFTRSADELLVDLDMVRVGSVPLTPEKARVGIRCFKSEIAVESVRLTVLPLRSADGR